MHMKILMFSSYSLPNAGTDTKRLSGEPILSDRVAASDVVQLATPKKADGQTGRIARVAS